MRYESFDRFSEDICIPPDYNRLARPLQNQPNNIEVSDVVQSWGYPFKQDRLSLNKLGKNNKRAVEIFDKVNWQ